ncbi:serine/threonine-protein kinase RsbT [Halolactibacillus alkaliphilus]|uniref:Serine/threonine-protein kinase RsbT n=1 Tax=Halolactibacillus alkaliphilus TaxID=442899 RepID=A0A511X122_9BACI|nr:anti-sigma regulatory factor [Halolactibacillus alkaliphilus]GEN56639.1 serine/threonine-protein kinase RsbT [Halolactibacillus alkaliphilus]GGN69886.1 serine/threonine-protein kinase RsbT [Halolactibacillus alkaliphilus]SFO75878.1 serine/threonine-protein kinase RsbT [Halolactibacillus alkaliphilus]
MEIKPCVNIRQEWDIVGARQLGREKAKELGFGTVDQARIATAISELARNIYLYAGTGKVYFETIDRLDKKGLKVVAVDEGPGIRDLSQVMQDGYSTSGGLGAGLPGVKRLMDTFEINTEWGEGTEIIAVKWVR